MLSVLSLLAEKCGPRTRNQFQFEIRMPRVSANHITALLKKSVNPLRGAEKDYD